MLATHGHFHEALAMLDQSAAVLETQPDRRIARQRSTYEREIERLRQTLREDLYVKAQQAPEALDPVN
jgi:hypothetical protein